MYISVFAKATSQLVLTHGFRQDLQGEVNCYSMKTWLDDKDNTLTSLEVLVRLSLCHQNLQAFFSHLLFDRQITAMPPVTHINLLSKGAQDNNQKDLLR